MIERIVELPSGVDGLRARGKVTSEDYEKVMEPLLDGARREGRRIRLLYHFGADFEGFTAGGAWEDARLGLRHLRLFERCAIVSDVGWIRTSSKLVGSMMPCPVKVFGNDDLQDAIDWLATPAAGSALKHRLIPETGVLVVEPEGALRKEDFDAVAMTVDPWIEANGELSGIVVHTRAFPGWENLGGFFRHIDFVRDHHRKVRRLALAADGKVAELAPKLAEHFVKAEVKRFEYDRLDEAIAWASGRGGDKEG